MEVRRSFLSNPKWQFIGLPDLNEDGMIGGQKVMLSTFLKDDLRTRLNHMSYLE